MANSEQARDNFEGDIGDVWVNDMVVVGVGVGVTAPGTAMGMSGTRDELFDASSSIGSVTATRPPVFGFQDTESRVQGDEEWFSREPLQSNHPPVSTPTPLSASSHDIAQHNEHHELPLPSEPALSLLPAAHANIALAASAPAPAPPSSPPTLAPAPAPLLFPSLTAALSALPPPTWLCPNPDPSIPRTPSARKSWVLHLTHAITNTTHVIDQPCPTFTKHWLSTPPFYPRAATELLAWDILCLAETLHRTGPAALRIANARQAALVRRTCGWSFARRIEGVLALLGRSKARCEKLFCKGGLGGVVGNPEALLRGSLGNQRQNRRRQGLLERGREIRRMRGE